MSITLSEPCICHPHEQTGIVIEGEVEMTVSGETRLCRKGDAFTISGDVEHSAASGESGATIIDTFSPPREDYM